MIQNRISYLNEKYLPHENCFVHIEDRGFQFADGVYEVTLYNNGKLIDVDAHLERLFQSLKELNIEHSFSKSDLIKIMLNLFEKNNLNEGSCYLQISRGTHNRVQNCPKNLEPTIVSTVAVKKEITDEEFSKGFSVITHDDIRWTKCNIKSVALLASTLVNQKAKDSGVDDAIFVRNNIVTEASFSNVFIVNAQRKLITKNADNFILRGITRNRIIKLAQEQGIEVEEREFNLEELLSAQEVFLTSSTLIIRPVVKINDVIIGNNKAGEITTKLRNLYLQFIE